MTPARREGHTPVTRVLVPMVPLVTERLELRPFRAGDAGDLLAYRGRADVSRWLRHPAFDRATATAAAAERAGWTAIERTGDRISLAIELEGRVVGEVVLKAEDLDEGQAEIGWTLHPDAQGHGYATEAATAVLDLAFDALEFHRVWAELAPQNIASAALCKRLGMRREGVHREAWHTPDGWADLEVWALLAEEWRRHRRARDGSD